MTAFSYPLRKIIPIFFMMNFIVKLEVVFSILDPRLVAILSDPYPKRVVIPFLVIANLTRRLEVAIPVDPVSKIIPLLCMEY